MFAIPGNGHYSSVIIASQLSSMCGTLCSTSSLTFVGVNFILIAAIPDSGASLCLVLPVIFLMINDTLSTLSYVKQGILVLTDSFIKLKNRCPFLIVFWFLIYKVPNSCCKCFIRGMHCEHFNPSLAGFFIFSVVELGKVQGFLLLVLFFNLLFQKYFPALQSEGILACVLI